MFKRLNLKSIVFVILFSTSLSYAQAESVLTQLPFGIKIGVTKNSEIEDRGTCLKKIEVSPSYFRCELYSMVGGKFQVHSSQNEIVSEVVFFAKGTLPQSWQNEGLKLANATWSEVWADVDTRSNAVSGTSIEEFKTIISSLGAVNIKTETSKDNIVIYTFITFSVGNYQYRASFQMLPQYQSLPSSPLLLQKDLGLTLIVITENY